jgi:hypothetical protein
MVSDPLRSPQTAVVFAQALTGLGHLRVSTALYHGLPSGSHAYLLNSQDQSINTLHRLMSIHPWLRMGMETAQSGWFENAFAGIARQYFHAHTQILRQQLQTIVDEPVIKPKTLLIVATHTFQGHQIAAIKDSFARTNNINVILVVVVTDDSPQHVWAVGGADFIIVPSLKTKRNLESYHQKQKRMAHSVYLVDPYMVSPKFGLKLLPDRYVRKIQMADPDKLAPIHVSVPVSGAAVQLSYLERLIHLLNRSSDRFVFHIVSQQSPATGVFLNHMIGQPNTELSVSASHREVVALYESLLQDHVVCMEITKPSEQSFKALCDPTERGGVLLLFSAPVGRQERDNLKFLRRHMLIPAQEEQSRGWNLA